MQQGFISVNSKLKFSLYMVCYRSRHIISRCFNGYLCEGACNDIISGAYADCPSIAYCTEVTIIIRVIIYLKR